MSACGSPLSSNRRIEPAVAVKASVRPGSDKRLLGGRIRRQAMLLGGRRRVAGSGSRPPPPFWPDGDGAAVAAGWDWRLLIVRPALRLTRDKASSATRRRV